MPLYGTVINGQVQLDEPANLPDGTRVTFIEDDEDYGPPPPWAEETREEVIASLREALADIAAGRGIPIDVLAAELKREFGVPPNGTGEP